MKSPQKSNTLNSKSPSNPYTIYAKHTLALPGYGTLRRDESEVEQDNSCYVANTSQSSTEKNSLWLILFIRIIILIKILIRDRIIQKPGKRYINEVYPVFYLYEKTAGPFVYQGRMDSECHR